MGAMRKREEDKRERKSQQNFFFQTFLLFFPLFLERFRSQVRLKHRPFWKKISRLYHYEEYRLLKQMKQKVIITLLEGTRLKR